MNAAPLVLLVLGYALVGVSSFTAAMSRRWGPRSAERWTAILRSYLGMPLVILGFVVALFDSTLIAKWGLGATVGGGILIAVGLAIYIWGHVVLGRITGWPTMHDTLVRRGPYAIMRHPITLGALFVVVGLFLVRPVVAVAWASALSVVALIVQTRLEELDLVERVPGYAAYRHEVPWLLPHPWRKR